MAKQSINLGSSANDGTGTTIRAGGDIVNDNFNELYTAIGTGSNLQITVSGASNGQALIYSSSNSRFEPANQSGGLSDIVGDTSPQLGGDLDVNSNGIISASNGNIPITPNGSGKIILDGLDWPTGDGSGGQFLQTNGSSQLAFATVLQNVAEDTSPQLGANLDVQTNEITTSTSNGNIKLNPNGTGVVEVKGDGSSADGTVQLNCSQNSHGIKLASPPHSAAQSYTLTFPQTAPVANKLLQTDGSGNLSFSSDLTIDSLTMSGSGNVTFTAATTLALNANTGGTVVVNDGSNNADFRVESDNDTHMLFVDAGSDHVNIKASADLGGVLNVGGTTVIQTNDNSDTLTLQSTDTDAAIGPNLNLYRNAGNGADADNLATVAFAGNDDAGNATDFARITAQIDDASNGSEDVYLHHRTMVSGTERLRMSLLQAETVFNEESQDIDFRVESDGNANMLFVDAGNDRVGIGTSSPTTTLSVNGVITHIGGTASSTSDLTTGGLHFHDSSTSAGDIMPITFTPSATADRARAGIGFISVNAGGSAGFAADIAFYTRSAADGTTLGTSDERMRINADGQVLIGGTNATFGELGITGSSNGDANIDMYASVGSSALGKAEIFFSTDSSSDHVSIASIVAQQPTGDQASRKGEIVFNVADNGGPAAALTIANNGVVSGNLNDTSDENLKKNITDLGASTDIIKALKPRKFDWKQTSAGSNIAGFVAQEVATVISDAVVGNDYIATTYYTESDDIPNGYAVGDIKDHGDKGKALNTTAILAHAVKTIQELEARITTLEG